MTQSNMTLGRISLYFAGFYIGFTVLVFAVLFALEAFFQFSMDSNVMGLIVPFVSAMQCGTIWFNKTGARPAGGLAWKSALCFAVIAVALSFALAAMMFSAGLLPELEGMRNDPDAVKIMAIVVAAVGVLLLLMCRLGFGLGAKQAAKLKEKQDAKAAR